MKTLPHIASAALLVLLAACGGSPTEVEVPPVNANEVPASATASATAYSEYAGTLAADDQADPLSVAKVVAPTSETIEPIDPI